MEEKQRPKGKDEMNLAVLPIAKLGRNDKRDTIEYYGTFKDGKSGQQQKMTWIVRGANGLPTEFAERVMVALLSIGAQDGFKSRKMTFTTYKVIKTLGQTINKRNYKAVEKALEQLAGVLITTDKAWFDKAKNKRITTKRGFHLVDEYFLHYQEDDDEVVEQGSYIVWGKRIWDNIQAGNLKLLDVSYYFGLDNTIARRLYRFLDKVMAYEDEYEIDLFALSNKLGMATYQYASEIRKRLKPAIAELTERGFLADHEYFKYQGKYPRVRFYKMTTRREEQLDLFSLIADETNPVITDETNPVLDEAGNLTTDETNPNDLLWAKVLDGLRLTGNQKVADDQMHSTRLLSIEEGTAVVKAGPRASWLQDRAERVVKNELNYHADVQIAHVQFIE